MHEHNWTRDEALAFVRSKRPSSPAESGVHAALDGVGTSIERAGTTEGGKQRGRIAVTKPSSLPTDDSSDGNLKGPAGRDSAGVEVEESPWSPPQFGLSSLLIAVTAFCLVCGVIKRLGVDWAAGFYGFAILGLFVWLVVGLYRLVECSRPAVRPQPEAVVRPPAEYANPDDALAAAVQLDMQGDWEAAIAIYRDVARRWPEHEHYVRECIKRIDERQSQA